MFRKTLVAVSGALLMATVACSSNSGQTTSNEQLAAYAASTPYPANTRAEEATNIGAVVQPSSKMIRVFNFGQGPLTNLNVWVNDTFVARLDSLPPSSFVNLNMGDFYDRSGNSLASGQTTVTKVQLQHDDHLWTLLGPIVQ